MQAPPDSEPDDAQPSLFGDDAGALIRVGVPGSQKTLSKAQKAFNRWTTRIEQQRLQLGLWREFADSFPAWLAQAYEPAQRRYMDLRIERLQRLDAGYDSPALVKRERIKLARVLVDEVSALLDDVDEPERVAVLVDLHDKHADRPYDDQRREEAAAVQTMFEDMLGVQFDADHESADAVLEAARAWMAGAGGRGAEGREDADAGSGQGGRASGQADEVDGQHDDERHTAPGAPAADSEAADAEDVDPRRAAADKARAAREQARRRREQALAQGATQSLRSVYRKLASALHPDREPDPAEHERKTALMQRVNQAYEAGDLLQLLSLQIEIAQLDLRGLAEVDNARLEQYNRVLKDQSGQLDEEIARLCRPFVAALSSGGRSPEPAAVKRAMEEDVANLRKECQRLAEEVAIFRDALNIKAWLKAVRITKAPAYGASAIVGDDVEALISDFLSGMTPGAARAPRSRSRRR